MVPKSAAYMPARETTPAEVENRRKQMIRLQEQIQEEMKRRGLIQDKAIG
ncbi:hypothetical protein [Thalassobacillus sp. C254]|nr:hypothetical protein [Thalassobacillus sp. C254]